MYVCIAQDYAVPRAISKRVMALEPGATTVYEGGIYELRNSKYGLQRLPQIVHIADGSIDVAPLITGEVGVAGVPQAFKDLANPEAHAKILVMPSLG